jgi:hypothetical protein
MQDRPAQSRSEKEGAMVITETRIPQKTLEQKLSEIFQYHSPEGDQPQRYEAIRSSALTLAKVICENTPMCADQAAAIRLLREAVMTANSAIALKGLV